MIDLLDKWIGIQPLCDVRANPRQLCRIVIGIECLGWRIRLHLITESRNDTSSYHDPFRLFERADIGQRIFIYGDHVGGISHRDPADFIFQP